MLEHIHMAAQEDLRKSRRVRQRYTDPTPLIERFTVYAVYHWHPRKRRWDLVAFLRTSLQRFPSQRQMEKMRVKLWKRGRKWLKAEKLKTFGVLKYVELSLAVRQGPPVEAPRDELEILRVKLASREQPIYLSAETS